jgi:site-specific DNA-methyltransferase (adenine-specific)/adenine-specific DNA-methyltransferase
VGGGTHQLTEAEVDALAARLKKGKYLDEAYRDVLFRPAREALLSYSGKEPRGSILAGTMGVPLQPVKHFGDNGTGWTNKLVFGDNLQTLKRLLELKEKGELRNADGSQGVRLCYIDPPFATKREFRGKKGQLAYRDRVAGAAFVEFLRKRLVFIHELLSADGALYMHLDTKKVHLMKVLLDEIFGPQNFRSEIIWKRSHAHNDTAQGVAQHGRIHDTILFYSKSDKWVWNPLYTVYDEAYSQSEYRHVTPDGRRYKQTDLTAAKPGGDTSFLWHVKRRQAPTGEPVATWVADVEGEWENPIEGWEYHAVPPYKGRYWGYSYENILYFHQQGLLHHRATGMPRLMQFADEMPGVSLQDLWTDIAPIGSSADEREDYPTQKPLALLERIVASSSNPGDVCLDCFAGSGTTLVAAEALDRRWIGIDCGKLAIYTAQRRLLAHEGKAEDNQDLQPFELCHAGLYDNALLEELDFEEFTSFTLDLFGCRRKAHTIGGIPMSGTRKGAPVHVFPFQGAEMVMGKEYIESLHSRIGSKVSGPVYVIVPAVNCDLFRDIFEIGNCMYFVLQVPYSVIEALHERAFQFAGQPAALAEVNDAIDSYGFDFIELPEAVVRYERDDGDLVGQITEFRRGGLDPEDFAGRDDQGLGDLAFVLVDPEYDGEAFRVEHFVFAADLAKREWTFRVPLNGGERAFVILMDTHGNELRQLVEVDTVAATPR